MTTDKDKLSDTTFYAQTYGERVLHLMDIPANFPRMSDLACYVGVEKLPAEGYFPEA